MNYIENLQVVFPLHPLETLEELIDNVVEELPFGNDEERMERMCTLLIEDFADQAVASQDNMQQSDDNRNTQLLVEPLLNRFPDASPSYIQQIVENEGNTKDFTFLVQYFLTNGYKKNNGNEISDTKKTELKDQIKQIFPDVCDNYLDTCINAGQDMDTIIDNFSSEGYTKSSNQTVNPELEKFHRRLCDMLPKFDPDFLLEEAKKLPSLTESAFFNCSDYLLGLEEYPTIAEYKKRQDQRTKMLNYIFHLKIDSFLKEFSNNLKTFENIKRKHSLLTGNNTRDLDKDRCLASVVLCYAYQGFKKSIVEDKLRSCNFDIIQCCNSLGSVHKKDLKESECTLPENTFTNKLLFQELAYVIYQPLIKNYLRIRTDAYDKAYKEAEAAGQLRTCHTCFDEGLLLMPEECFQCMNGCDFCKQCMIKGCEVAYSDGLLEIDCFDACGAKFSDNILHMVMDPVAYFKLMQRKQIKAIREANVDGLETCPFCDYCTVMAQDDKIFVCRGEGCGKESCRECGHEAHIPLRCNEIEYDEDVKMRTAIENEMSAALIRTCKKCNASIIKEAGCNKMTCTCGKTMCYVCGESGINYNHFGGKCAQQSNQDQLHRDNVLRGAQVAKARLGVDKNPNKLKFDPSKDF